MKAKPLVVGLMVAAGAGLGFYALIKWRHAAPSADEAEAAPSVVTVQIGTLKRMTLHRYVTGFGMVAPAPATATEPAADAPLAAPTAGVVAAVNVVEGQRVKKGETLMTLNSGAATANYAEQELARQKRLYAEHNTSLKNLQNAEAQLAALQVVTPLSGAVVAVNVKPGAAVDVSAVVAEVMDLNRLVVKTDIPASQAGELEPGQDLQVLTEPSVTAPLAYVSPTVNTNNNTVRAWAALPANSGLRPGQFVPLRVVTAVHTNCLAAPEESVVTDANGRSVLSRVNGNEATRTPVQTGFHDHGWVEVNGTRLKAGDSVVTVGAYGLPDKTQIRVANSPGAEISATNSPSSPTR